MRLEDVTAEIRPRSDWEAVDLGFAMVRRDFWRCFAAWWLGLFPLLLVSGWFLRDKPMLLFLLFWWGKPAGSRMVLFELSRRLFGEKPSWKAVFTELPKAWFRRFFFRFIWARFSPWLPMTLPIEDLESLRGKAYRQRVKQLGRRGGGTVTTIFFMAGLAGTWLGFTLLVVMMMLLPDGQDEAWKIAWETWDRTQPFDVPGLIAWPVSVCAMLAMMLVDLFVIGAGFGIYVNNRTWLEGWDVELAFKRLGQRLGKMAALLLVALSVFFPMLSRAEESGSRAADSKLIGEVKAHPDFKVHSITQRIPKSKPGKHGTPSWLRWLLSHGDLFSIVFAVAAGGLLLSLLGWLIWKNRRAFLIRGSGIGPQERKPAARVVMGMEVTAESLPKDIPAAAWALWQQGRRQESLGLLYRGAISKVIDLNQVEIQESDTEGDCLRRVEDAGAPAHPEYFRGMTAAWIRMAYAGQEPPDVEIQALCEGWPFPERRRA